jgi:hypothetical protein
LTAAEGDDEGVIDGADGSADFVGIVAASTASCRSPCERGCRLMVTSSSAAAPLPLLGAARLRYGSACLRSLRAPRAPCRGWLSSGWRRQSPSSAWEVVHSSSSWPPSRRRHWEWRLTGGCPSRTKPSQASHAKRHPTSRRDTHIRRTSGPFRWAAGSSVWGRPGSRSWRFGNLGVGALGIRCGGPERWVHGSVAGCSSGREVGG